MAVKISGVSGGSLRDVLDVIISKQSEKIILKTKNSLKAYLIGAAKTWQVHIRNCLSNKAKKLSNKRWARNESLWPKLRTGMLRRSILLPEVHSTYKKSANLRKNQIKFKIKDFYGSRAQNLGVMLNEMTEENEDHPNYGNFKPFAGWIRRANDEWDYLMKRRLKSGKGMTPEAVDLAFKMKNTYSGIYEC